MTAKEFLRQYEYAEQRARMLREQYETETLRIDAVGSTLGGEPGMPHGTGISRKTEDKAIRLADKALAYKQAELDAIEMKQAVFDLIWDIPSIEGKVLYDRYILLMTWEKIAELEHYSYTGIHYAHRRALEIVEGRLNGEG